MDILVTDARICYANIWEPRAYNDAQKPRFSAALIISKEHTDLIKQIKDAIEEAKQTGTTDFGPKWKAKNVCLKDGDTDFDNAHFANSYVLKAWSYSKPTIVDRSTVPILDPSEVYGGCYVNAIVWFYPYNFGGGMGVNANLGDIQKVRDGEKFAPARTAQFEILE